jgi:hypothetical protein
VRDVHECFRMDHSVKFLAFSRGRTHVTLWESFEPL